MVKGIIIYINSKSLIINVSSIGNASISEILRKELNGLTQYTVSIQPNTKFDYTFIKLSFITKSEDLINTPRDIQSEMTDIIESIKW